MSAEIIDGKAIAAKIEDEIRHELESLKHKSVIPGLSAILVGDDPASKVYVNMKAKACQRLGFRHETIKLPADTTQHELIKTVQKLNGDLNVHGILVQLPLPAHLDSDDILHHIDPHKDVDGFHPENKGLLAMGKPRFAPATPHGIQELLMRSHIDTQGKHVVIAGRSNTVGAPLAQLFLQKGPGGNATVTICHSKTKDMASHTRQADILVAAMGQPEIITSDMVKEGAVVIDVGVNRVEFPDHHKGYKLVGDVNFDAVVEKASMITPVPGGVGPMTIVMLMKNTLYAAKEISLDD